MNRREDGFTIVEIGVIVPLLMIIALALFSVMFTFLLTSDREQTRLTQTYESSDALARIEDDIRLSSSFLTGTDPTVSDPVGPPAGGAWDYDGSGADNRVLILREVATTNNSLSDVRSPVYTRVSAAAPCNRTGSINGRLAYNIVYFVDQNTLYRRIVTDRTSAVCGTQYQRQSCPEGAAASGCAADDEVVARDVTAMRIAYYASQSDTVELDAYANQSLLPKATSAFVTLISSRRSYEGNVSTQTALRMASSNVTYTEDTP